MTFRNQRRGGRSRVQRRLKVVKEERHDDRERRESELEVEHCHQHPPGYTPTVCVPCNVLGSRPSRQGGQRCPKCKRWMIDRVEPLA